MPVAVDGGSAVQLDEWRRQQFGVDVDRPVDFCGVWVDPVFLCRDRAGDGRQISAKRRGSRFLCKGTEQML